MAPPESNLEVSKPLSLVLCCLWTRALSHKDLHQELDDEVSTILSTSFTINVVKTNTVPHAADPAITFPNLDDETQGAKLIDTTVLYIDIRRSTDLNLTHQPHTVAKLYSAFIRAMTRTARYYKGHVRGIIGDRLMVLFDVPDSFENAVETAVAMNTVGQHVINKHFKANEVSFGIGIDAGKMLATKTGIRRLGGVLQRMRLAQEMSALRHVWTAPLWQGLS